MNIEINSRKLMVAVSLNEKIHAVSYSHYIKNFSSTI